MGEDLFYRSRRRLALPLVLTLWAGGIALGLSLLWRYQATPGITARAPAHWPENSRLERHAGLPTLVLFLHPHCPCSRATLQELNKLMTRCHDRVACTALLLRPAGLSDEWARTDLWYTAAAIPQVKVLVDAEGVEARRFGAATSGQALLYTTDGKLAYTGGLTFARGEEGDNAGRAALTALILADEGQRGPDSARESVYGCALFDAPAKAVAKDARRCGN